MASSRADDTPPPNRRRQSLPDSCLEPGAVRNRGVALTSRASLLSICRRLSIVRTSRVGLAPRGWLTTCSRDTPVAEIRRPCSLSLRSCCPSKTSRPVPSGGFREGVDPADCLEADGLRAHLAVRGAFHQIEEVAKHSYAREVPNRYVGTRPRRAARWTTWYGTPSAPAAVARVIGLSDVGISGRFARASLEPPTKRQD